VITLNDGNKIPAIGFGTYPIRGNDAVIQVGSAIGIGYRLIDTAFNYDNEAGVGRAVNLSDVPREDLFVTSKLPGRFHQRPSADAAILESLWRLGLDQIDLYLIHWPNPIQNHYVEAWRALIDAREAGIVESIGVSNFTVPQLERLQKETGVLPAVNQIECHPYHPQVELVTAMHEMGIVPEAWRPLGKRTNVTSEPEIVKIAAKYGVSPSRVVLRWHIQRGLVPIPKASDPRHQAENIDVFGFELDQNEMEAITGLGNIGGPWSNSDPNEHEEM
jgi:Aldo/keto reductases, related to diketogulonate reductase